MLAADRGVTRRGAAETERPKEARQVDLTCVEGHMHSVERTQISLQTHAR